MKKLVDALNPKCEKITQNAHDYLFRVNGGAEGLSWDIHLLYDYLDKTYTLDYDGYVRLQTMAAQASAISNEIVDLINAISEKDMEP